MRRPHSFGRCGARMIGLVALLWHSPALPTLSPSYPQIHRVPAGHTEMRPINAEAGFAKDRAWNLRRRVANTLPLAFSINSLNELSNTTWTGALTASGFTAQKAANVTVNGQATALYGDNTFATTAGLSLTNGTNAFVTVAVYPPGRSATNTSISYLPSSNSYASDLNGNLTNDGNRVFLYNDQDQLTNVMVTNAWMSQFAYDALGRRRIERDFSYLPSSNSYLLTNELNLIYDGNLPIQERDINNNALVSYPRGLDLSGTLSGAGGIGGLLARTDRNGTTFYHSDGSGNITALVDWDQFVDARYLYDPFGGLIRALGPLASLNEMQFSSMPHHANSGLSLYGRRAYDAGLQRFLNRDPVGELGGLNLFGFVGNASPNRIDPYGQWPFSPDMGDIKVLPDGNWYAPPLARPTAPVASRADEGDDYTQVNFGNGTHGAQIDPTTLQWGKDTTAELVHGTLEDSALAMAGGLGASEAEGAYASANKILKAARAAKTVKKARCFKTFKALKRAYPNSKGKVWHHLVEQSQIPRFGAEAIQNMQNVVEVSPELNSQINALYSSIRPEITGSTDQTIRQWLSTQSFGQAQAFAQQALQNVASGKW